MSRDFRDEELFDETRLRRALRLDPAELPPRFDFASVAAAAEADRPASALAALMSRLVAGVAAAVFIGLIVVALPAVAPAVGWELLDAAIAAIARAAVPVSAVLAVAEQPSIPLAATFALAVAAAYEYAQRRERLRAITS